MPDEPIVTPPTNARLIQQARHGCMELAKIEEQYRAAKMFLADGNHVVIPQAQINALKQRFAAIRTEVKAALDAVTA